MAVEHRTEVLTDARRAAVLEPLIEDCCPRGESQPHHLRRTPEAIVRRHENGAERRAVPPDLGPSWWMAARTFIRWSRRGVWELLPELAHERGLALGTAFLDGTSVRAHAEAAGRRKRAIRRAAGHARGV
jgi:transposase